MNRTVLLIVILALLLGGGYVLLKSRINTVKNDQTTTKPSPTSIVEDIIPDGKSMNDMMMAGGSSYSDPAGLFTFLYPNDYTFDTQNNGQVVRVYKKGPTQQGQTEMYDGIIVTFEKIDLKQKSLSDWLDQEIQTMNDNGVSEVTQPKKAITLNGFSGYSYAARGLGVYTFYVIQKDAHSPNAIRISRMVSDPTNVGFQEQSDQILASITMQK